MHISEAIEFFLEWALAAVHNIHVPTRAAGGLGGQQAHSVGMGGQSLAVVDAMSVLEVQTVRRGACPRR